MGRGLLRSCTAARSTQAPPHCLSGSEGRRPSQEEVLCWAKGEDCYSKQNTLPLSHPGRESFLAERLLGRGDRQSSLRETRDPLKEEYHSKPEPNSPDRSLPGIKSTVKA